MIGSGYRAKRTAAKNKIPLGFKQAPSLWEPYYTILPRKINGRWYCCSRVYRRFNLDSQGGYYKYGDAFDYLRDIG
jgi:hypothetical protein